MKNYLSVIVFFFLSFVVKSQSINDLKEDLEQIISSKNATIGISIKELETNDTISINGNLSAPMMSVFKFHIALTVLNEVDKGKLKLEQKFFIKKADLHADTWSPIKEKFPNGNIYLTLDELIRYTVSHSDNNGCDILLNIIGGTDIVQKFINEKGIKDFTIKVNEQEMSHWENLYKNTTTPLASTELLEKFYKNEILKKKTTRYLYQVMIETSRGITWMKAGLPKNTELAHRTGMSGTNDDNLRVAMNDIGIFKLPNGNRVILSVYLKEITESFEDTEKIIADITKIVWNYYTKVRS